MMNQINKQLHPSYLPDMVSCVLKMFDSSHMVPVRYDVYQILEEIANKKGLTPDQLLMFSIDSLINCQ